MPTQTVTTAPKPTTASLGFANFALASDSDKKSALGKEIEADGNTYRFIVADEAIAQYAACRVLEDNGIDELTTTNSGSVPTAVCVPQVALASGEYGWAVVKGTNFSVLAAASCAADVVLYTTATAGVVDDASTDQIVGLRLNATNGGSQAAVSASATTYMRTN